MRGSNAGCAGANGTGSFSARPLPRVRLCHSAFATVAAPKRMPNSPRARRGSFLWACQLTSLALPRLAHFFEDIPGYFWFQHGYSRMLDTLPLDRPSAFVEIGSFHGKSTAFLAVEALNRGIPVTIHCVD